MNLPNNTPLPPPGAEVEAILQAEEEARRRRILIVLTNTFFVGAIAFFVVATMAQPERWLKWLLEAGSIIVSNGVVAVLARRGWTTWAGALMVTKMWLQLTAMAWLSSLLNSPAYWGYLLPVFIGGLVIGRQIGAFIAAMSALSGFIMLMAMREAGGAEAARAQDMANWAVSAVLFGLFAVLQWVTMKAILGSMRHAREELHARIAKDEQLQKTVSLLSATLEATADGILVVDRGGQIRGHNSEFLHLWRIPPELWQSREDEKLIEVVVGQLADPKAFTRRVAQLYASPEESAFDLLEFKDGRVFERHSHPQRLNDEIIGRVWSFRDVTWRRKNEARHRDLIDLATDGIILTNREGVVLEANPSACKMVGRPLEEVVGRSVADFVAPDDRERVPPTLAEMQAGKTVLSEWRLLRGESDSFMAELSGKMLPDGSMQGMLRDVTERKRLEEEMRQVQKLEEIGKLAGGVAHDFNNLITAMFGHVYFARAALAEGGNVEEELKGIETVAGSAANLTRQLLAFARRQIIHPQAVDLNSLCLGMARMLQRLLGASIELAFTPAPGVWRVRVDPGQMEQVIVNLCVNARDAMPGGGRIVISTANLALESGGAVPSLGMMPGDYAIISVADTGCGMDEATMKRIFEPFFTTKAAGKGTGLGLATCHGIVMQSGGHIAVKSKPGQGTSFHLYLPRFESAAADATVAASILPIGTEKILLVEDEARVRSFAANALRTLGYDVTEASNGEEALRAAQGAAPIALLLTDVIMPRMGGLELAEKLLASRPDLPILYTSGYTDDLRLQGDLEAGRCAFLQKPYTIGDLATKVRRLLDGAVAP